VIVTGIAPSGKNFAFNPQIALYLIFWALVDNLGLTM